MSEKQHPPKLHMHLQVPVGHPDAQSYIDTGLVLKSDLVEVEPQDPAVVEAERQQLLHLQQQAEAERVTLSLSDHPLNPGWEIPESFKGLYESAFERPKKRKSHISRARQ